MAIGKIVVRQSVILSAFEVAASVAFGFIAFRGVCTVTGEEYVVVYPTSFNR